MQPYKINKKVKRTCFLIFCNTRQTCKNNNNKTYSCQYPIRKLKISISLKVLKYENMYAIVKVKRKTEDFPGQFEGCG